MYNGVLLSSDYSVHIQMKINILPVRIIFTLIYIFLPHAFQNSMFVKSD